MIVIHESPVFKCKSISRLLAKNAHRSEDRIKSNVMSIFIRSIRNQSSADCGSDDSFLSYSSERLWNNRLSADLLAHSDGSFFSGLAEKLYSTKLSSTELAYDIMLFINAAYSYILASFSAEDIAEMTPGLSDEGASDWIKYGHYKKTVNIVDTPYAFQVQLYDLTSFTCVLTFGISHRQFVLHQIQSHLLKELAYQ